MMYIIITTIDQSYYLNIVYKNKLSEIKLILANFLINMIY
jgi:hypothetical protein